MPRKRTSLVRRRSRIYLKNSRSSRTEKRGTSRTKRRWIKSTGLVMMSLIWKEGKRNQARESWS